MSVNSLVQAVGLGQSALSQHLARLRGEGVVAFRRDGTTLYYRLADERASVLLATLRTLFCPDMPDTATTTAARPVRAAACG
jgi:DNA-binding transcriptional ArsR family regulator